MAERKENLSDFGRHCILKRTLEVLQICQKAAKKSHFLATFIMTFIIVRSEVRPLPYPLKKVCFVGSAEGSREAVTVAFGGRHATK